MLTQETLRKLNAMKLFGMAQGFEDQLSTASASQLSFEERFGLFVDHETTHRENTRLRRLLKNARLRENACIENIDFRSGRGLERSEVASLAQGNWLDHGHNLIVTGPTGSGKTWFACALGNQACRQGRSVSFQRLPLMLEDLAVSHGDGSFRRRLQQLGQVDLLILDDFGMSNLNAVGRNDLLEVIEQRSGARSILITSQLPVDRWHNYLAGQNPTVADAILDRLVSGANRIDLQGESMRKLRTRRPTSAKP